MKLTIFLIIVGLFDAHANGFSQTVTFSGKNVPITKVFAVIEKQTGYTIFANKDLLKSVRPLSVAASDMPLKDFLELILRNQPIDFEINNRTIFIKDKPAPAPAATENLVVAPPDPLLEISGTITSSDGIALQGATILVKGNRVSAVSDAMGHFTIHAEPNQVLVISFVGYQTMDVPIKGRTTVNVVLQKTLTDLGAVVVTALGIKKRTRALTYNVQEVSGEEVNTVKDANFVNSLNGKVAGVTINSSSSGIGGSARVVMRGAKSLFGNNNALYVVDGVQLPDLTATQPNDVFQGAGSTGDGISNINPEDIASISVLTGPAAAALYGSQAANGVILITTKKGAGGKLNVNISNNSSFFSPFVLPKFQNEYGSELGSYSSWGDKLATPSTYDPADFFQTGTNITNTLSLSTGTDKNQTYFSAAAVNATGIIPNNKLNRYNFSVRNTSSFLDDKVNLDLGLMYIDGLEQNMLSQGQYFNPLIPIYLFPRGDDIRKYQVYERYDPARNFKTQFWPFGDLGFQMQNPYWIVNRDFFNNDKKRYVFSTGLKYNLADWVNIAGRVKLDNNNTVGEKKYDASTSGLFASPAGAYYNNNATTQQLYADLLVNINKTFFHDYTLAANIGTSILDTKYSMTGYGGNLLSVPNLFNFVNVNPALATPTQDGYHDQTQSVFGSAELGYKNMIFLNATGRNDWSSALINTTAKSIFYPSVGVSGVVSDLIGFHSDALSFIKVRGSYSEVGNAPQRFITIASYPIIGGFPATSSYLPATGLQPERTKSFEAGLNLKFLRNKISLDVTAYQSSTYNQLFNPTLAPSTGYSSFYINAGEVSNKGIEAALGVNEKFGRLGWTANATFSLNRNKIVQLLTNYTDKTTGQTVSVDSLSVGGTGSYMEALVKGGSIGDIYVTTLQTDGHGYIDVGSVTQTVTAAPNTYIKAGNASPRYNIGFRNSFDYKNFNLSFLVTARIGGVGVSITQAVMDGFGVSQASAQARDQGGALVNGYRIPAEGYYSVVGGGVAGIGSMYVYSATNVRLGEASIGYTIPAGLFHNRLQGVTVSAIGRNLFMFYNKAPFDPESTANTGTYYQGIDYFMQPSLRSLGFSVKVQF
ncbi:MAG TPA: SusC/RagA family TonB-linked outer membrane protein [Puia sp.]|nr:SusC/RagA family TonB-linked outer membrane protein [Puia sp.]